MTSTFPTMAARDGGAPRFTHEQLMHGHDYSGEECAGWLAQRKRDGWFAGWDGERLFSKEGNTIHAPDFFLAGLPSHSAGSGPGGFPLCCELVASKEGANRTQSLVRQRNNPREWELARLYVFDAPRAELFPDEFDNVLQRLSTLGQLECAKYAEIASTRTLRDRAHLRDTLNTVLCDGGEGLMISPPDHPYTAGRTRSLLKVKRQSLHFLK